MHHSWIILIIQIVFLSKIIFASNNEDCDNCQFSPHLTDCRKYYQCDNGEYMENECPSDLYFNPEIEFCDWPELANCKPIPFNGMLKKNF